MAMVKTGILARPAAPDRALLARLRLRLRPGPRSPCFALATQGLRHPVTIPRAGCDVAAPARPAGPGLLARAPVQQGKRRRGGLARDRARADRARA